MKTSLCGLGCLLLACGGKQQVNLGDNDDSSGWVNTQVSPVVATNEPTTAVSVHEAQTIYDRKDTVLGMAVDETTIAALIQRQSEPRLEMCRFEDCKGTYQAIDGTSWASPGSFTTRVGLLISHGEVLWFRIGKPSIDNPARPVGSDGSATVDSAGVIGSGILACSITGCPEGPRQVTPPAPDWEREFTADSENVYWLSNGNDLSSEAWQVARCPRSGCQVPEFVAIPDAITQDFYSSAPNGLAIVTDGTHRTLYISSAHSIVRIPTDFSAPATLFYRDSSSLGGIAVVGDYVYFARSTMLGGILRCPTSGCDAAPELVHLAPRWPSRLVADERALYWLNKAPTSAIWPNSVNAKGDSDIAEITGVSLGGTSKPVTLMGGLRTGTMSSSCAGPVLNSHHLYWCEVTGSAGSWLTLNIRSMQR